MNLKERAGKLKTDLPALFLALKDRETPVLAKVFAGITVAYALSPVDLIPDFIPVLGYGRVPQGHPVIVDYFYHEEIRGTENTGKRNR